MATTKIPTYKELNAAIKKIADIPSRADDEGAVIADGIILTKNVYDLKNGAYELHVRDKKNNKWKVFDTEDGADCVERAAKCFVDFYNAQHKSESHKFSCSMQKKKESLSKKQEAYEDYGAIKEWLEGVMDKAGTMFDSCSVSQNRPGEICAEIYGYDSTGGDATFSVVWMAGDDFAETISAMADELVEFAEDFDPEEEAKLYSDSGLPGVPSLRQLLKDMDERKEDMVSLAGAVSLAASKL